MSPEQFLQQVRRGNIAPAYLFLGPESYHREMCRRALIEAVLGKGEAAEEGLSRHDLEEVTVAEVIDDASAYSLFAPRRVIWVTSAESALPRGRVSSVEENEGLAAKSGGEELLARYMANPTPGVAVVFQAGRYSFEGEDKAKVERIRKFYAPLGSTVEFAELTAQEARLFARELARRAELTIDGEALEYLTESLGASAARIATEIEKLRLYRGRGATISEADIAALAPDARETTIFALVAALGRGDRRQSMRILDTLVREGEYLPLALNFLATQLRMALVAREAGLKGPQQVQAHFTRLGTPMWRARAEQVWQTASLFSKEKLARSLQLVFQADHGLRDTRPDDRIVMERFILSLTA